MLRRHLRYQQQFRGALRRLWQKWRLQIVLWTLWSLAVVATAYANWRSDIAAQLAVDSLRMVIRCVEVGVGGLIVITLVEMRLEPWRFRDQ